MQKAKRHRGEKSDRFSAAKFSWLTLPGWEFLLSRMGHMLSQTNLKNPGYVLIFTEQ